MYMVWVHFKHLPVIIQLGTRIYGTENAKWQPAKSLLASLSPGPENGSSVHAGQNFHTISWPSGQTN